MGLLLGFLRVLYIRESSENLSHHRMIHACMEYKRVYVVVSRVHQGHHSKGYRDCSSILWDHEKECWDLRFGTSGVALNTRYRGSQSMLSDYKGLSETPRKSHMYTWSQRPGLQGISRTRKNSQTCLQEVTRAFQGTKASWGPKGSFGPIGSGKVKRATAQISHRKGLRTQISTFLK
jgi:hypothetical protein